MSDPESADAIAVFRPRNRSMILPFLDLDDGENSDGLYAEELADGSFLVSTFQPFAVFEENPEEGLVWLQQFGIALPEVHDDPRGVLFFPDDHEPDDVTSYDEVVTAVGDAGVWIGGAAPSALSSFEVGQMFEQMQRGILETIAEQAGMLAPDGEIVDDEFEPEDDEPPKK